MPIGNILRFIRSNKNVKELKGQQMSREDRMASIREGMPLLNIDRSDFDDAVSLASSNRGVVRDDMLRASGGRVAGEDQAREAIDIGFSNAVNQAQNTARGSTDILSLISSLNANQNQATRDLTGQLAQQREQNIQQQQRRFDFANRALGNALTDRGRFNQNANLREFEFNQQFPYMQALQDERALENAIRAAKNGRTESAAAIADGWQQRLDEARGMVTGLMGG